MNEQKTDRIILFEFREEILEKKVTKFLGAEVEDVDSESEFKKVEPKLPLYDNLDSDKILLFVDSSRDAVWMWCGRNTDSRMKSVARKLVPSIRNKYGIGTKKISNYNNLGVRERYIIANLVTHAIDEGSEPLEFKLLIGLIEESDI